MFYTAYQADSITLNKIIKPNMTGGNIFINDAFTTFDTSMDAGEFIVTRPHLYKVYENDDDVCIITSLDGVRKFFDRLEPFVIEAKEIEAF